MDKLQILVSALLAEPEKLIEKMNISSDAVLVNQCNDDSKYDLTSGEYCVHVINQSLRGIGVSRNAALEAAKADIVLFADDDIVYEDGAASVILKEFSDHPEADGIFFNFEVDPSRRTYNNTEFYKVNLRSSGRFPTFSLAVRREAVVSKSISFSPLFGGGAKYSCGEDSLFIMDCLKKGLKLYASPVNIGKEVPRASTWFHGYDEKFFFDRGVLYHFLYGSLAKPLGLRFLIRHRKEMCGEISVNKAYSLLKRGIIEGRGISK